MERQGSDRWDLETEQGYRSLHLAFHLKEAVGCGEKFLLGSKMRLKLQHFLFDVFDVPEMRSVSSLQV